MSNLDESLRDYWVNVTHYRKSGKQTQTALLDGHLTMVAGSHKSQKTRQLLMRFITKEKGRGLNKPPLVS